MADLTTVLANVEAAIEAIVAGLDRMTVSDHRLDLERIARGTTRYQLRSWYEVDDGRNSAAPHKAASLIVEFHHHLGVAEVESTYTDGEMVTIQSALSAVAFWKGIVGIREVRSGPDTTITVRRTGNIISYGHGVEITLD